MLFIFVHPRIVLYGLGPKIWVSWVWFSEFSSFEFATRPSNCNSGWIFVYLFPIGSSWVQSPWCAQKYILKKKPSLVCSKMSCVWMVNCQEVMSSIRWCMIWKRCLRKKRYLVLHGDTCGSFLIRFYLLQVLE